MLRNKKNKIYIGISKDISQRVKEHNSKRGSIYTEPGDFKIVFLESYPTLVESRKREIQLKKWRRDKKEILIERYGRGLPTKMQ